MGTTDVPTLLDHDDVKTELPLTVPEGPESTTIMVTMSVHEEMSFGTKEPKAITIPTLAKDQTTTMAPDSVRDDPVTEQELLAPKLPDAFGTEPLAPQLTDAFSTEQPDFAPELPEFSTDQPIFAAEVPDAFSTEQPILAPELPEIKTDQPILAPELSDAFNILSCTHVLDWSIQ